MFFLRVFRVALCGEFCSTDLLRIQYVVPQETNEQTESTSRIQSHTPTRNHIMSANHVAVIQTA